MPIIRNALLLFTLLIPQLVGAETFSIKDEKKSATLFLSEEKIEYSNSEVKLSLIKNKCNTQLIKEFNEQLHIILSTNETLSKSSSLILVTKSNGQQKAYSSENKVGVFLRNLEREFKSLKIQERLYCR